MSLTDSETLCRDRLMGKRQAVIGRGIVRVDLGSWLGILDNEPLQMLCIYPLCTLSPNLLSGSVTDSDNGGPYQRLRVQFPPAPCDGYCSCFGVAHRNNDSSTSTGPSKAPRGWLAHASRIRCNMNHAVGWDTLMSLWSFILDTDFRLVRQT